MPTKKQLSKLRASDLEYFLSDGSPKKSQIKDTKLGSVIGAIKYDPDKKDMKVTIPEKKEVPKAK